MNKRLKKKELLRPLKSIKKVQLNDNDTIIIECNLAITVKQQNFIKDIIKKMHPKNKILVLQKGINFKVVSE